MPAPIPDDVRAAILADIEAGKPRNQIARDHGVSGSTVTKLAKQVEHAFDRSQTKIATEAAVADNKALRAKVSRRFLDKADELLDQMSQPHLVFNFGGKDNDFNSRTLDKPPTADLRNLMTSAAIAFDKHIAADRHDADTQGLAAVDAWLRNIVGE